MTTPKEVVTILSNAVDAKVHEASRNAKLELQRILSYKVAGAEHSMSFKQGTWDGRSSFLNFRSGIFPAGFVHFVAAKMRHKGFEVRLVRKPLPNPLGPEKPVVDAFPEDPRYDYQRETVSRLVKHGQIIAQVATGGGKSRIARLAFARINRPTLFLTTRSALMYQMKETFEKDLGVQCSVLGDGQFGLVNEEGNTYIKKMTVGMVQTLTSRLREPNPDDTVADQNRQNAIRNQTIALLSKFEFIILEEAHEASGNSYFEIMRHCKNAHYRLALTATPFMKDDEESNMRLMAVSGPIGIKISEKLLIDRGILARPFFKIVHLTQRPKHLTRGTGWQSAYRLGIVDNDERNQSIVNEVVRAKRHGMTSMILIQQRRHGDVLQAALKARGVRVRFIQGENDQRERAEALRMLGEGKLDAVIGTTILDVGVDVPSVYMIVLAGGGKAEVGTRQRIGRGLRAKKNGPNKALVVDFDDPFNNHTKEHAMKRLSIIKDTEGFNESIIYGDFDYPALGFTLLDPQPKEL
ncbi:MAG: helicase [Rhodospirillales bacterium 20-64-7]|nr:MAG: helicase [Rhodospirillales bacterium 20-64-7]